MSEYKILKYPRTPHLEGSRLQAGDEDLNQIPFSDIAGQRIIVEEKCDGANTAVSFDVDGSLLLQSRGHYLTGGYREKHYQLMKQWANQHMNAFFDVLGTRYIMYGEWLYAKHTVYYDRLPHYFLEFDVFDREAEAFLSTSRRHELLSGLPVVSVPVLRDASFSCLSDLTKLIAQSHFIGKDHITNLREYCERRGEDAQARCAETDASTLMEGLYIKVERDGTVVDRMKFVRPSFLQTEEQSNTHWLERSIVPNQLIYPMEYLFMPTLPDGVRTIMP